MSLNEYFTLGKGGIFGLLDEAEFLVSAVSKLLAYGLGKEKDHPVH